MQNAKAFIAALISVKARDSGRLLVESGGSRAIQLLICSRPGEIFSHANTQSIPDLIFVIFQFLAQFFSTPK